MVHDPLKPFVCCYSTQNFECGSVGRHFLQTELNRRAFKYGLMKGMAFIPVHTPFSSSSIYYSTFSAFLKGNTEEIEKLTENMKRNLFQEDKFFWVGSIFLGRSGDRKNFMVGLSAVCGKQVLPRKRELSILLTAHYLDKIHIFMKFLHHIP